MNALEEITRFEAVLTVLDLTHQLNGSRYTPPEISGIRKNLNILKQLIESDAYKLVTNQVKA